jgi:hypothetical protein
MNKFKCSFLNGKFCGNFSEPNLCCYRCKFLRECLEKWNRSNCMDIYCKIEKRNKYCSAIIRFFKDNPNLNPNRKIKVKVILI